VPRVNRQGGRVWFTAKKKTLYSAAGFAYESNML
jgi:hypothetical protein